MKHIGKTNTPYVLGVLVLPMRICDPVVGEYTSLYHISLPRSGEGLERGRPARLSALGNQTSLEGTPKRVGEHLPIRFGVQFKLVWFYYAQKRAGRPRSSPRRFAAIVGCADVTARRSVTYLTINNAFPVRVLVGLVV